MMITNDKKFYNKVKMLKALVLIRILIIEKNKENMMLKD